MPVGYVRAAGHRDRWARLRLERCSSRDRMKQKMEVSRAAEAWSPYNTWLFLIVFAAVFFAAPYFVPVRPSVSVSYVVGFSNRAAILIFAAGTAIFAWLSRGRIA